jgi:hypothetical protein
MLFLKRYLVSIQASLRCWQETLARDADRRRWQKTLAREVGKRCWQERLEREAGKRCRQETQAKRRWQITGFDGMNSVCIASLVNASIGGD